MANGGFKHETQRDDLVVQGAARGWPVNRHLTLGHLYGLLAADRRGGRPVHPVLLHLAGGDLGDAEFAEEGDQV